MKKLYILLLIAPLALYSCKEDEEPPTQEESETQEMEFNISHTAGGENIKFAEGVYTLPDGNKVQPSRLSYLLSNFYLLDNDGQKVSLDDQYAYIQPKAGKTNFKLNQVPKGTYKAIGFSLGLDSAINHGDPNQYPVDHPLSAVNNALHWSWVGGYIFIAIEGQEQASQQSFIFHIAGAHNKVGYEIPVSMTKNNKMLFVDMELVYEEIFKNPALYDLNVDGMSTHSTTDAVTQKLVGNLGDIFKINSVHE